MNEALLNRQDRGERAIRWPGYVAADRPVAGGRVRVPAGANYAGMVRWY